MRSLMPSALESVVGALEVTPGPGGATIHRCPARDRRRLVDAWLEHGSAVPSGVRLEALTDAAVLELDVRLSSPLSDDAPYAGDLFDVVLDGELQPPFAVVAEPLTSLPPEGLDAAPRRTGTATLRLDLGVGGAQRRVEVWFPVTAELQLLDVRVPDGARFRPAPPTGPSWVNYGSSISECSAAERPTATWPALVARAAGRSLVNLGLSGQCHLDQFMAEVIRDLPAQAISLELGVNVLNADSMRERTFVAAFHAFLDTVRSGHPHTPVLVVTPIVFPAAEDHPGPTAMTADGEFRPLPRAGDPGPGILTARRIRELLRQCVDLRRSDGDADLHLLEGPELFGTADLDHLPDGLHPDAAGYRLMGERFLERAFGPGGSLV